MPPRYAYWTIIVDNQPTAFRSGSQEELMPTFKRLKAKNDTAVMMWWQHGKLWTSRVDAQESMLAGREAGRRADERQTGAGFRDRERKPALSEPRESKGDREPKTFRERSERPEWRPKSHKSEAEGRGPGRSAEREGRPEWKPKGSFTPAPRRDEGGRFAKPDWKSKPSSDRGFKPRSEKPAWKPKGSFDREERPRSFKRPDFKSSGDETRSAKPEWKPKGSFDRERKPDWKSKTSSPQSFKPSNAGRPEWKPKGSFDRERPSRSEKPEWKPKGSFDRERTPAPSHPRTSAPEKRKWMPKEEYKKSMGIEAKRDDKWRPGGEHKDPRQKYKDAKKAKWTKFKQNVRARSGGKGKKQS